MPMGKNAIDSSGKTDKTSKVPYKIMWVGEIRLTCMHITIYILYYLFWMEFRVHLPGCTIRSWRGAGVHSVL